MTTTNDASAQSRGTAAEPRRVSVRENPSAVRAGATGSAPPQLAPGVELVGEMVESAFKKPPWLISRSGRFIQVSRLLYAVADRCDGSRRYDEIARLVSGDIKRDVGADDVATIVGNLARAGIVRAATTPGAAVTPMNEGAASPLGLRLRMLMLSPRVINPMTAVLRFFFWPPVVVAFLAVGAAVEAWIY